MSRPKNLITGNSRREERLAQNRLQGRIANAIASSFQREISGAMRKMADQYEDQGTDITLATSIPKHQSSLEELAREEWYKAARMAGDRILGVAKCMHGKHFIRKNEPEDRFEELIDNFIRGTAIARIAGVASTTLDDVRRRIARGEAEGLTVDEIARNLRQSAPGLATSRAMMIARTESHSAYNMGTQFASMSSELDLRKEWISSADERTRDNEFDHVAADGETVDLEEAFINTGEALMFPGDPTGSAGNVVYCRCGRGDVLA